METDFSLGFKLTLVYHKFDIETSIKCSELDEEELSWFVEGKVKPFYIVILNIHVIIYVTCDLFFIDQLLMDCEHLDVEIVLAPVYNPKNYVFVNCIEFFVLIDVIKLTCIDKTDILSFAQGHECIGH